MGTFWWLQPLFIPSKFLHMLVDPWLMPPCSVLHTSKSFKFTVMFGLWTYYSDLWTWTQIRLLITWKPTLKKASAARNRNVALFMRTATWGDGRLLLRSQLQRFCLTMKVVLFLFLILFVFVIMKILLSGESFGKGINIFHCLQTFFWLVDGKLKGILWRKLPSSTWVEAFAPTEEH